MIMKSQMKGIARSETNQENQGVSLEKKHNFMIQRGPYEEHRLKAMAAREGKCSEYSK